MERFIVGTGRCGSTLLSHMLGCNGRVLSLSEFWSVLDRDAVFKAGSFTGPEVAALAERNNLLNDFIISRNPFMDGSLGHEIRKEVGNALRAERFPALKIFLGALGADADRLYSDAVEFLAAQPRRPLGEHWRALFAWLSRRFGREVWIERSGVSLEFAGRLIEWYPNGRFAHIHRDGPTNALGIRAFRHFVLYTSFFLDPPTEAEFERAMTCEIGGPDDPVLRRMTRDIPALADFGRYWSWQIASGTRALMRLPPEQRLDIRYEDLVADPDTTLRRLADFFELPDDGDWIERAKAQLDPEGVPDRVSALDSTTLAELKAACLPGQVLLGRDTANGFEEAMVRARRVADRLANVGTLSHA